MSDPVALLGDLQTVIYCRRMFWYFTRYKHSPHNVVLFQWLAVLSYTMIIVCP